MMPALSDIALPFLLASASCIAAAMLIWLALSAASRYWPVLEANRSVWLLSQTAIAAVFVLALLPQRGQYSVLPPIAIERGAQTAAPHAPAHPYSPSDEADGEADENWLELAALAWLALYAAGLLWKSARWAGARRHLRGLLAASRELDAADLAGHAGFARQSAAHLRVLETDAAISPMLIGVVNPRLLLPAHLRHFAPEQQGLIVAHELTHFTRRDPVLLHASLLLQTVFWFNPILRLLGGKLHWAQELGCDREVLAGRPEHQRQHYAAALVAQLKLQQAQFAEPAAAMAFGGAHAAVMVARVRLIRDDGLRRLGPAGKSIMALLLAALLAASVLFQPAFAGHAVETIPAGEGTTSAATVPATSHAVSSVKQRWIPPLEKLRVTSFYGAARKTGRPHRGIDFAAHTGTAVLAVADGVVRESTDLYQPEAIYGKVIVVEHAGGLRSFYAHLDQRRVDTGDVVKAGQLLGQAGETGRATGPHLHLEAFDGDQRIDPQRLLTGLDAHATNTALRLRPTIARN